MSDIGAMLWEAVNAGNCDAVKKCLETGAFAEHCVVSFRSLVSQYYYNIDKENKSVLMLAAEKGYADIVAVLVASNVDVNRQIEVVLVP